MPELYKPYGAVDIKTAMTMIRYYRAELTRQQKQTLCGQVLSGDIDGAMRGLKKIAKGENDNGTRKHCVSGGSDVQHRRV